MGFNVKGYDPEMFNQAMVFIPGGKAVLGLKPAVKRELAKQAGVHPDMLHFQTNHTKLDVAAFWIDRYPVTRGQFLRFLKATGYRMPYNGWLVGWAELTGWKNFTDAELALPMVGVGSEDAEAYAAWIGKRLPTESEWEKAWRGDDGRLFPWGKTWQDGFTFRNPGNTSLKLSLPAGCFPETGPYGLSGYGQVLEWVKTAFAPHSKDGAHQDGNPYLLAGGSFRHNFTYSFLPSNRSSWHHTMRIYNSGFRCVSTTPPQNLVKSPKYTVTQFNLPRPLQIRREAYGKEKIQLFPCGCATFGITVPWFPESAWYLDCPEGDWGPFGGANAWPYRSVEEWELPWIVENDGQRLSYRRSKDNQSLCFEAVAEGDTVRYRIDLAGLPPQRANTFCFKTFSPFFSSQERGTQVKLTPDGIVPVTSLPIPANNPVSFFWYLGEVKPPERAALRAVDGSGCVLFPDKHLGAAGNGWVPCTHITPGGAPWGAGNSAAGMLTKIGEGSFTFAIKRNK